jgi:hypothetical protein
VFSSGCAATVPGLQLKERKNNGQLKITWDGDLPVFSWKACTTFGLKSCQPDEFKLQGINVSPINCSSNGKLNGDRKSTYNVTPAAGAFLTPPIKYGEHPANTTAEAVALTKGCRYDVTIQVADGTMMGIWIHEEFEAN